MSIHRSESVNDESITAAAAKAAFPVGVSGGLLFGMPISDLVQIATLLFLILQIGLLVPKYWTLLKRRWWDGK